MTRRRARTALAPAALALALGVPPAAAHAAVPAPPMQLPGDASAAGVRADEETWLVGARPGRAAARIARAHGAEHVGPAGTGGYAVARSRARALAAALRARRLLVYAQPNVLRAARAMPVDPLDQANPWRARIVDPALTPPAVTAQSPLIALVDAAADVTHPDLAPNVTTLGGVPVIDSHGTATASVAVGAANGVGLSGVWPGGRALNVPLGRSISCRDSADGIAGAVDAGAAVINMSYGSAGVCYPEYVALQLAVAKGIVPVAAAGNEADRGNPLEFPASLPHVVTVAALGVRDRAAYFSNENGAIDVAAPGKRIPVAVPVALDTQDGTQDGWETESGTSFATPMVSAAIAWVRAVAPDLAADQAVNAVRYSARDIGPKGYDAATGYGLISVGAALTAAAKPGLHDPAEPNDDIVWVDGRAFGHPDHVLYRGNGPRARIAATLDSYEDPDDVYRVKARPHGSVHVAARAVYGNVTLTALTPGAHSIRQRRHRVARSAHAGGRTERVTIHNGSRKPRTFFVSLSVAKGRRLDAGYVLSARR